MGPFNRSAGVQVAVTPDVVRPRHSVTATVTTDNPIDKVTAARLEWGYDNFYRYHWAGRADSAAATANDTLWMAGEVGTSYGGERETDDWVCVTRVDVPLASGQFDGAASEFKIPSWAPASSDVLASWSCRLIVERGGRDLDERGGFQVVIGSADVEPADEPLEHYMGGRDTELDIVLPTTVFRAGEAITGHVVCRPRVQGLPNAEVAVYWQRQREHHPLERYPGMAGSLDGPPTFLGKKIPMHSEFGLPFALPLPADAAPSGTSVSSTVTWCVGARIFYSGFTSHQIERVRRPIVVVNAP